MENQKNGLYWMITLGLCIVSILHIGMLCHILPWWIWYIELGAFILWYVIKGILAFVSRKKGRVPEEAMVTLDLKKTGRFLQILLPIGLGSYVITFALVTWMNIIR